MCSMDGTCEAAIYSSSGRTFVFQRGKRIRAVFPTRTYVFISAEQDMPLILKERLNWAT